MNSEQLENFRAYLKQQYLKADDEFLDAAHLSVEEDIAWGKKIALEETIQKLEEILGIINHG